MVVPTTLCVFSVAAASWGVYAAYLGLDLGLGAMPLRPLFEAPLLALDSEWRRPFVVMMTAGLLTLSITAICGLERRVAELWAARRQQQGRLGPRFEGGLLWGGVYASALVLSLWPGDAWRVLLMGLGLAASAWLVARVATDDHGALAGSLVGSGVFAAMSLVAWPLPPWAAAFALYPVLAAAPLAAAATVVLPSHARRSGLPR